MTRDRSICRLYSQDLRRSRRGIGCAEERVVRYANHAPLILALFILTQVLDGALTYWGVSQFGLGMESNAWLAALMKAIGPGAALVAAKSVACLCGVVLFSTASFRVLAAATGWCFGFA